MPKRWSMDSREDGDDANPGLIKDDLAPTDPSFTHAGHWRRKYVEDPAVGASMTTATNLQDTGAPFTGPATDWIGHYVRLVDSALSSHVMKITAVDGTFSNLTVVSVFFGAPALGAISAYYVGGPKRSRSSWDKTGGDPNVGALWVDGDFGYRRGFFTGEATVNLNELADMELDAYGAVYDRPITGQAVLRVSSASAPGSFTYTIRNHRGKSDGTGLYRSSSTIGTATIVFNIIDCEDEGDHSIFKWEGGGSGNRNQGDITGCKGKSSVARTDSSGFPAAERYLRCIAGNQSNQYLTVNTLVRDNLFRSASVRSVGFVLVWPGGTADHNTFVAPDNSGIIFQGAVLYDNGPDDGGATRFRKYWDIDLYSFCSGQSGAYWYAVPAHPHTEGLKIASIDPFMPVLLDPVNNAHVGTSSTGANRGGLRSGAAVFGTQGAPLRKEVINNARSFGVLIGAADVVEDGTTGGLKMSQASTLPFSVRLEYPYQGHTNPFDFGGSGAPSIKYDAGNGYGWDAGKDMSSGSPTNIQVRRILAAFSSIVAQPDPVLDKYSIWDSIPGDGNITIARIRGWTAANGFVGVADAFDVSDRQMLTSLASTLATARYYKIELAGTSEG